MAARAIWKGVVHFEGVRVPVKLYSAVEDRNVRFKLLERKSKAPIAQQLVHPETDAVVPYEATRRGFVTEGDELVVLGPDDLARLEPQPSRDILVRQFVPPAAIDHRWYDRPYYLGPDGDHAGYVALARALDETGLEGVAQWTMRKKAYVGALRVYRGYPVLVTLRNVEEVVPLEGVERPPDKPLDDRQLAMARQLLGMLEAPFEPEEYRDQYRDRVLALIESKRQGEEPPAPKPAKKRRAFDLDRALERSLQAGGRRA
jgi:DNA end-binding protein Ku